MNRVLHDLRYGLRTFRRQPGFALVAILTLALGIGANTAIFSVVNAVLLKPLPYNDPDQLVYVWVRTLENQNALFSGPGMRDFQEQIRTFEGIAQVTGSGARTFLGGTGDPERINVQWVSHNFFTVYGVAPILGRTLTENDVHILPSSVINDPNASRPTAALVISYEFFERRFGADPSAVGEIIQFDRQPTEIVGVLPPGFKVHLPPELEETPNVDAWLISVRDLTQFPRDVRFIRTVGRMKPGVTIQQAQADVDAFAERQREQFPVEKEANFNIKLIPLHSEIVKSSVKPVLILMGAVGFVLLIACANIATLLLARSAVREKESAIRSAMGAGRLRLVQQALSESFLLALIGAAVGLVLARLGITLLLSIQPEDVPRLENVGLDTTVLGYTLLVSLVASLLFGVVPAARMARTDLAYTLREGGRSSTFVHRRMRSLLVVGEVALAMVLLVGAGLLLRSFVTLHNVEPGFNPENVLTSRISLASRDYPTPQARLTFFRQLQEELERLPEVETASIVWPLPLNGTTAVPVTIEETQHTIPQAFSRNVTPGFFEAMGIELLAGRVYTWADLESTGQAVVIVDEKLATSAWPGEVAVGKRIAIGNLTPDVSSPLMAEVIGVVANVRSATLSLEDPESIYVPFNVNTWGGLSLALKTTVDPVSAVGAVRGAALDLDANLPLSEVRSMEDYVATAMAPARFSMSLISVFGAIGLIMTLVGIYGVISYSVNQRLNEVAIRMALGAERKQVLKMVVGEGLALTAVGLAMGLALAFGLTRFLKGLLYGVSTTDPATFVLVILALVAMAFLACFVPARRAATVDAMITLRCE